MEYLTPSLQSKWPEETCEAAAGKHFFALAYVMEGMSGVEIHRRSGRHEVVAKAILGDAIKGLVFLREDQGLWCRGKEHWWFLRPERWEPEWRGEFDRWINGEAALECKHLDQAETAVREALALAPQAAYLHFLRGLVLSQKGHFDQAIQELQQSLANDPAQARAYWYLAEAQTKRGEWKAGLATLQRGLRLYPDDTDLQKLAAWVKPMAGG